MKNASRIATRVLAQMAKSASGLLPEDLAQNYFFANPYGLDFHTWAGMQDTNEGEEVPTEPMPEVEGEEPPYDSSTEAEYMPNAPQEEIEPTVSPATPVPVPAGKFKKTSALLQMVAAKELTRRGIIKVSNGDEPGKPVVRQKVEEFLRRNAQLKDAAYAVAHKKLAKDLIPGGKAQGKTDSDFDPKQMAMGANIEKEHTPDSAKAREIARDHLEEFPQYYSALKAMEKRLEEKKAAAEFKPKKFRVDKLHVDEFRPQEFTTRKMLEDMRGHEPLNLPSRSSAGPSVPGSGSRENHQKILQELLEKHKKNLPQEGRYRKNIEEFQKELQEVRAKSQARMRELSQELEKNRKNIDIKLPKLDMDDVLHRVKPMGPAARILLGLGGAAALGAGGYALYRLGKKEATSKFGLDASELLGQDEQRKDDLHQQTVRHNEENHQIDLAKGQLELQQAQETFNMKQQQQAQKNQEQMAQQQMMQQMQQQQQQQMSQGYLANMAGGGQQPPQQGMQGPR